MKRKAGLKEVIQKITQNIRNSELAKYFVDKVTNYVQTKNKSYDLTNQEAAKIYKDVDYSTTYKLNNGKQLDIDWTNHGEYRSDLRDIKPERVNEFIKNEMIQRMRKQDFIGREPIKKPGIGTVVLDYNTRDNPGSAAVITVYARRSREEQTELSNKFASLKSRRKPKGSNQ